jgi:hypothetical protein
MKNPKQLAQTRPAETATPVAMAIALLIGKALDADSETIGYIAIVASFVPAAVTWLVEVVRG